MKPFVLLFFIARHSMLRSLRPFSVFYPKGTIPSDEEGFSLLEMVVVLAIIGILIAIQLPNVIGNTERARTIAAFTVIKNAITECAVAKTNGVPSSELIYFSPKLKEHVPSLFNNPDGYKWESGNPGYGCTFMVLVPVDDKNENAIGYGNPVLYAKLASGGRILKAAAACQPYQDTNYTEECKRWDPTISEETWNTGRDLNDPEWAVKDD